MRMTQYTPECKTERIGVEYSIAKRPYPAGYRQSKVALNEPENDLILK